MRRAHRFVVVCVGVAVAACGDGAAPSSPPDTSALDAEITALRLSAQFEDAMHVAEARERILDGAGVRDWRRADSRRDIATLRRLCALPDTARTHWRECASAAQRAYEDRVAQPADAVAAQERWIDVCTQWLGPDSPEVATAVSMLAAIHDVRNNVMRAHELDTRALAIRTRVLGPRHPDIAASLDRVGYDLKRSTGSAHPALEYCERALAMRRDLLGEESREYGASLLARANLRRLRGETELALEDFAGAEAVFAHLDGERSARVAEIVTDRGLTLGRDGRWAEAEPVLRHALATRRALGGSPDATLALALNQLGVALRELGRLDAADSMLREAATVQEQRWREAAPGSTRAAIFQMAAYHDLAQLELRRGRWTEAWVAFERLSSRVAVDVAIARGELDATGDPWADLLPRVQRALPDSAAMIGWLDSRYGGKASDWPFWCFVVRKTGPPQWFHVQEPDANQPPLRGSFQPLVDAMHAEADWPLRTPENAALERACREIYHLRMAPMEAALDGIRTLIVTSPDMNYGAPVEALIDGEGRVVAERFVTSYAPSALLYANARERSAGWARPRKWKALLVGNPTHSDPQSVWATLPPLHGATQELSSIARDGPPADVFVGARASEAMLDSLRACGQLARYDLIHFATHAAHYAQWPAASTLLFAEARVPPHGTEFDAGQAIDGRLSAEEIGTSWRLNARLVSLAACRGFSHLFSIGEGPQGIGLAFFGAGARSVLLSSYSVDDVASQLFFSRYATLLFAPVDPPPDPAVALRAARLWLRDYRAPDGSHPYASPSFWSGFVLVGWPG
jgi:CHAT domain-containing protein/tetratricopeptide (TPR) repeat protein